MSSQTNIALLCREWGKIIVRNRKKLGINVAELSEQIGMSTVTIGKVEKGLMP